MGFNVFLFEFLILETFQAGLSWITILRKRENFRKAFDNFDYLKIAHYDEAKYDDLLMNPGIIRNKLKTHNSAISDVFIVDKENEVLPVTNKNMSTAPIIVNRNRKNRFIAFIRRKSLRESLL